MTAIPNVTASMRLLGLGIGARTVACALAMVFSGSGKLSALTLISEGFQTPGTFTDAATIAGTNGWVQFNGNSAIVASAVGLGYSTPGVGTLNTTAGSAIRTGTTTNVGLYQNTLNAPNFAALGDTVWFAFLVQRTSTAGAFSLVLGQVASNTTGLSLGNVNPAGSSPFDVFYATTRLTTTATTHFYSGASASFANDTNNLLVGRMSWDADGANQQTVTLDAWLNPALDANLSLLAPGFTVTGDIFTATWQLKISTQGGLNFDEIRIGDSQASVIPYTPVPEPGVMSALGSALCAAICLGRSRGKVLRRGGTVCP